MSIQSSTIVALALLAPGVARAQWTPQRSGTDAEFRGLAALSPTLVWASGTKGRVARTTDGGRTWTVATVQGAEQLDLRAIAARGATRAWAEHQRVRSEGGLDEGNVRH